MATRLEIINAALAFFGARPITSTEDESKEASVAERLYESEVRALLAAERWHFASRRTDAGEPLREEEGRTLWRRPEDCLRVLAVNSGERRLPHRIIDGGIAAASSQRVDILHIARVDEADFPDWFTHALSRRLAALFYKALSGDTKTGHLEQEAQIAFMQALDINRKEVPPPTLNDGKYALIEVR